MLALLQKQLEVTNVKELDALAERLAPRLRGGETIELISDLGGGKTAFVRCLVGHLNSTDAVASPSFTIENVYRSERFDIHHFDFYRLDEPGICAYELAEAVADSAKLVIVEWGDIVADILPKRRLSVTINRLQERATDEPRSFVFKAPLALGYLIKSL